MTGDPIEDLLKKTGKRREVPADRRDRVRAAVQEMWREDAASHARRRRVRNVLWLSAAALAIVLVLLAISSRGSAGPSGLVVTRARGDAWTERGPWIFRSADAVLDGAPIVTGGLVTTDTHAKVALTDAAGRSIRLDGGTALRVDASDRFVLVRGAVYVDTGEHHGRLHIETPRGTLEDVGTQFQARLDGERLVVRVREGTVTLRGRTRPATAAAAQVIVADAAKVAVAADPEPVKGWDWAEAAGPMLAIEGRSLADFIAWAARERGARVRWAEPGLAAKAAGIVLRGSVENMTLDQAMTSVMTTSGWQYRWEAGELLVAP